MAFPSASYQLASFGDLWRSFFFPLVGRACPREAYVLFLQYFARPFSSFQRPPTSLSAEVLPVVVMVFFFCYCILCTLSPWVVDFSVGVVFLFLLLCPLSRPVPLFLYDGALHLFFWIVGAEGCLPLKSRGFDWRDPAFTIPLVARFDSRCFFVFFPQFPSRPAISAAFVFCVHPFGSMFSFVLFFFFWFVLVSDVPLSKRFFKVRSLFPFCLTGLVSPLTFGVFFHDRYILERSFVAQRSCSFSSLMSPDWILLQDFEVQQSWYFDVPSFLSCWPFVFLPLRGFFFPPTLVLGDYLNAFMVENYPPTVWKTLFLQRPTFHGGILFANCVSLSHLAQGGCLPLGKRLCNPALWMVPLSLFAGRRIFYFSAVRFRPFFCHYLSCLDWSWFISPIYIIAGGVGSWFRISIMRYSLSMSFLEYDVGTCSHFSWSLRIFSTERVSV